MQSKEISMFFKQRMKMTVGFFLLYGQRKFITLNIIKKYLIVGYQKVLKTYPENTCFTKIMLLRRKQKF